MGVPTSEVGYTIATTRRETTKVHKNMWWHWGGGGKQYSVPSAQRASVIAIPRWFGQFWVKHRSVFPIEIIITVHHNYYYYYYYY